MDNSKVISVNVCESDIDLIDEVVKLGGFASRSEAIRDMIRDWCEYKLNELREKKGLYNMLRQLNQKVKNLEDKTKKVEMDRIISREKVGNTYINEVEKIRVPKQIAEAIERGEW